VKNIKGTVATDKYNKVNMDPKVCRRCGAKFQTRNQRQFHEVLICKKILFGKAIKAPGLFIYTCKQCDKSKRQLVRLKHGQTVVVIPLCPECRERNVYKKDR